MDWEEQSVEAFRRSVAEVTLRAAPESWWNEFLAETDVPIAIAGPLRRGEHPWLDIAYLGELRWASQITRGTLLIDHFEHPNEIDLLDAATDLTIVVAGTRFDDADLRHFQRAILELKSLKTLRILVEPEALEEVRGWLIWPHVNFTWEVGEVERRLRRMLRTTRGPGADG